MLLSEMRDICLGNEICPKKWGGGREKGETLPVKLKENLKLSHRNLSQTNTEREELRTKDLFPKRRQGKDCQTEKKSVHGIINTAGVRNDGNQYHPARLDTFLFAFHFLCGKLCQTPSVEVVFSPDHLRWSLFPWGRSCLLFGWFMELPRYKKQQKTTSSDPRIWSTRGIVTIPAPTRYPQWELYWDRWAFSGSVPP